MKLTVTQENLAKALSTVSRIASGKTSLPVLGNILLRTEDNRLQLAATNLEIAVIEHIGGSIKQDGAITVPARLFHDFIHNLPAGNVNLSLEGATLNIKSGGYSSKLHGMSAEEFPALPQITAEKSYQLDAGDLRKAISQVALVASSDDTRPVLTGVFWHTHNGGLYMAGTDGYRLAEKRLLGKSAEGDLAAIVPASTLQEVGRVLSETGDPVKIELDENQISFNAGGTQIISKLIEGKFPDYRQLIPEETEIKITLEKDEFARITKVASLFARDSGGGITLTADGEENKVSIHSIASQMGENTSESEAEITKDGKVTLNSRYLTEALNAISGSPVTFAFNGKLSPCVLTSQKADDYKHIIMPLNS